MIRLATEAECAAAREREAASLFRHKGTGVLWRCLGAMRGRLPGGVRREGMAAVPAEGGEAEWRDIVSWERTMEVAETEDKEG